MSFMLQCPQNSELQVENIKNLLKILGYTVVSSYENKLKILSEPVVKF